MPNAKDLHKEDVGKPKIMLVGSPGSGKTSLYSTLPGRTLAYIFDPAALSTLRGADIDYEIFVPSVVSLAARSLKKGVGDTKTKGADAHEVYLRWEDDFEKKKNDGTFDSYDNIVLDSFTTFSDIVMDRILHLNGRGGQWPQQDDWTAQMGTIKNVVRTLAGQMDKVLLCTAHDQYIQDEQTKRMVNQVMLTGQLRTKLPLLFSDIFHCECVSNKDSAEYRIQTRPDRVNPTVRTSFRDLEMFQDVTIKDWDNRQKYGLGKLFADHNLTPKS